MHVHARTRTHYAHSARDMGCQIMWAKVITKVLPDFGAIVARPSNGWRWPPFARTSPFHRKVHAREFAQLPSTLATATQMHMHTPTSDTPNTRCAHNTRCIYNLQLPNRLACTPRSSELEHMPRCTHAQRDFDMFDSRAGSVGRSE